MVSTEYLLTICYKNVTTELKPCIISNITIRLNTTSGKAYETKDQINITRIKRDSGSS